MFSFETHTISRKVENLTWTTQSNISTITILVSNSFSTTVRAFGELITPWRKGWSSRGPGTGELYGDR